MLLLVLQIDLTLAVQKSCSIEEGITTSNVGKIALSSTSRKINVLLKIDTPNITNACKKYTPILNSELQKFHNQSHELVKMLKTPLETGRPKRQLFAILGATLLSRLGFITSEIQMHSINTHLHKTQRETKLKNLEHSTLIFEKSTIGLFRKIISKIDVDRAEINCEIGYTNLNVALGNYMSIMTKYLDVAALGQLQTTLTPNIIDYTSLKDIVAQHPSFESSMFKNNPTYLYGLATLTLVDIHVSESIIQFIIEFPTIYHNNIAILYHVQQLGLHTPAQDQCIYFDLPSHFFEMDNTSWVIPLNNKCHSHKDLTICETYKHLLKTSCISHNSMKCSHTVTRCTAPFHVLYTSQGLLLRDNSEESYMTEIAGSIRKIKFLNNSIAMAKWENTKNIFISQQLLVENPGDQFASNTRITNFGVKLDKIDYYPIDSINISSAYAEFFEQQNLTPIDTLNKILKNSKFATVAIVISTTIIAIVITVTILVIIKCRNIIQSQSKGTPWNIKRAQYIAIPQFRHSVVLDERRQSV